MNLNQVTVFVADISRSIDFYAGLGLRLIVRSEHYARFECPEGESTFSIHLAEGPIPKESSPWVYFEINDLDHKVSGLVAKAYLFEELPNDKPWLWREARLKDPDGNQVILYHAGRNRKNPPWRLR